MIRGLFRISRPLISRSQRIKKTLVSTDQSCPARCRHLATSKALKSNDQKEKGDESTKNYIQDNPELEKILKDLYDDQDREKLVGAMQTKFNIFKDDDSPVVYDVDEERERLLEKQLLEEEQGTHDTTQQEMRTPSKYAKYGLEHGTAGVFDVSDLVDVLVGEKCQDVVVMAIP